MSEKILPELASENFFYTFAPQFMALTYGVMVAQQILVLLVQVRILVGQQKSPSEISGGLFCLVIDPDEPQRAHCKKSILENILHRKFE